MELSFPSFPTPRKNVASNLVFWKHHSVSKFKVCLGILDVTNGNCNVHYLVHLWPLGVILLLVFVLFLTSFLRFPPPARLCTHSR